MSGVDSASMERFCRSTSSRSATRIASKLRASSPISSPRDTSTSRSRSPRASSSALRDRARTGRTRFPANHEASAASSGRNTASTSSMRLRCAVSGANASLASISLMSTQSRSSMSRGRKLEKTSTSR